MTCPICECVCQVNGPQGDCYEVECPRCGTYIISHELYDDAPAMLAGKDHDRVLMSYKISRSSSRNPRMPWTLERLTNAIETTQLPSVVGQSDGVLEWIGNHSEFPGDDVTISSLSVEGFCGAVNSDSVHLYLKHLEEEGLIIYRGLMGGDMIGRAKLTLAGWSYYDNLTKGKLADDKAFMAMKFGDAQLDQIVKDHFRPAVLQAGYRLFRLDERPEAGLIDIRLRQEIKTSKFVIADLTHENLGAYWEAGFAEGVGKRVIYTCSRDRFELAKTHFDVNHHLTVIWDQNNLTEAVENLKAAIRYTFPEARQID